ncbi:MAG: rod shape-determining protein MreC [Alphaproteobacteria bacterium]|nr:rod shape-determining protein MreC [Alphaproteobacteria bacterium]
MKPTSSTARLAIVKQLAQRFAFTAMAAAAFALMLVGKADTVLVERLRTTAVDAVTPVLEMLSRPAATMAEMVDNVRQLAHIRTENTLLREENLKLMRWQEAARRLETENGQLKSLLNFVPGPDAGFVAARVVADSGGAFAHSVLINAGSRDGVRKGQAVVSGEGLVGRVHQVGQHSSRVLLLSDLNSHLPVMLETTRTRAIMTGDNSERPKLNYLSDTLRLAPGDRVVTSGHGGVLPPGLPVGLMVQGSDGAVRVEPFVDRHKLEYVRIVDYGLGGTIAPPEEGMSAGGKR